jgi:SpoVK/Ycf46/Vps4 family AAA+-type ATPase
MDANIKEMIKFQMISKLGGSTGGQSDFKSMFVQFFMFIFMGLLDDIIKAVSKFAQEAKVFISASFNKKITENIVIKTTPKLLADTSITLNTRHEVSIITMNRIFKSDSQNNTNSTNLSDESNGIVDALIAHISKLENIPNLSLINNGQLMMTYKDKPIQITTHIYLKIDSLNIETSGEINSIKLSLLSNTLSSAELAAYIKNLYDNHQQEIKNSLGNKIYYFDQKSSSQTAPPMPPPGTDEVGIDNYKRMRISTAPKQLAFTMTPFYSNKKFSNIYGEEVRHIEKRIHFFMNNKDWYDERGIPYQIGLLLSGIPGAGKTSIIRALANLTKRHIVNVNFANITTASQLKNLFYSDKLQVYKDSSISDTQSYFIPTNQRIYVLEELDAIGNIVKQRTQENMDKPQNTINDELTLMEILTVLDGTMEIPGRIVIMTTNHPEVLDKALIRPGRIDIQTYFGYSKRELIAEMFEAYFDMSFPSELVCKIPDKMLSPAEIGQILFKHFDNVNIDNIIEDLNETVKKLGRDQCVAIEPTVSVKDTPPELSEPAVPEVPVVPAVPEPSAPEPNNTNDFTPLDRELKALHIDSLFRPDAVKLQLTSNQIAELYEAYFEKSFTKELICKIPDQKLSSTEIGKVFVKHFLDPNMQNIIDDLNKLTEAAEVPHILDVNSNKLDSRNPRVKENDDFNNKNKVTEKSDTYPLYKEGEQTVSCRLGLKVDHGPSDLKYKKEEGWYPLYLEDEKNGSSGFDKNKIDFVEATTTNKILKIGRINRISEKKINIIGSNEIKPFNMTSDNIYEELN